jgi:hypothetical protein
MGWVVNSTPRPPYVQERNPVPIVQEAVWAPGPVWTGAKNLVHTSVRSPDRPARSESLYRMEQLGYHWMIFMKFDILVFFENTSKKLTFDSNLIRIAGTLDEDICIFISRSVLCSMRNVSDRSCKGDQNTHFMFSNFFPPRKLCRV